MARETVKIRTFAWARRRRYGDMTQASQTEADFSALPGASPHENRPNIEVQAIGSSGTSRFSTVFSTVVEILGEKPKAIVTAPRGSRRRSQRL
jgi:hypothetical protein